MWRRLYDQAGKQITEKEIWERLENADIRGLSGSGFPTIQKLKAVKAATVDKKYFIVNAVACDPGLLHDAWLLKNHWQQINEGIKLISQLIHFDKIIVASPENVPNRYPMGEERILIHQFFKAELSKDEIPAEKGYLVLNVQTVFDIYQTIIAGKEEKTRFITVANLDTGAARIAEVRIGQSISDVLKVMSACEDLKINKLDVMMSSAYMGTGIMEAEKIKGDEVISPKDGFIGFGTAADFNDQARCKGCGACSRRCPRGVKVHKLIRDRERGNTSHYIKYHLAECMECGTCSYYCRAGKDVMAILKKARGNYHGK